MSTARVAGLLVLLFALKGLAATQRHALVIAYNGSDRPGSTPLRFADDDGYRWRETFERLGIDVLLLTVPDADTARLEAGRGVEASPPTIKAVEAAVAVLAARVEKQRAAGDTVDVLLVYVGHGHTGVDGRAYLNLADGRLDQEGLYRVVDGFGADYVHLIIDACHAGGVVGSRGLDPRLVEELKATLVKEQLKARPNVGALYAESDEGETHEWSRIRAGVFSHAARSGLLGAADVNRDSQIAYSELDAFVASAIRGVKAARGRLQLKTSAPALDANRILVGRAPSGPTLNVPSGVRFARLSIEDADGIRLADVYRQEGEQVSLSLPKRPSYWLRTINGDARVALAELNQRQFTLAPAEVGERGGVEESYERGLFAIAFGRAFYEGYQASSDTPALRFSDDASGLTATTMGRFDGAWLGLGLSIGLPVSGAPLGASGVAAGVSLAWRSEGWLYAGARAQWIFASDTFDGAGVHRAALAVVAGVRGWTRVAPFLELGPHWAPTFVVRSNLTQGDFLVWGGTVSAGVMGSRDFLRGLRVSANLSIDSVRIDGARRPVLLPQAELSITF